MPTAAAPAAGTTSALRGVLLMLVATAATAGMNACVRYLSAELHPFAIMFFRCVFGLLVLSPLLMRSGLASLRTSRLGLHAVRAVANVLATLLIYLALALAPLAKVTALDFSAPLFAAALAMIVLREPVRAHRLAALVAGLAGVVMVVRPDATGLDLGAAFALLSGAIWGLTLVIIKVLSRTETSLTSTVYAGLFMTPLAFLAAAPVWQTPSVEQIGWLALMGALAGISQLSLAQALREASVTVVLPIDFTKLIWAALLGYVLFGESPDLWTIVGGSVIFAAVCYIAAREGRAA